MLETAKNFTNFPGWYAKPYDYEEHGPDLSASSDEYKEKTYPRGKP